MSQNGNAEENRNNDEYAEYDKLSPEEHTKNYFAEKDLEFSLDFFEQHGLILASLEALRIENIDNNPVVSWAVSVIEELAVVAKKDEKFMKIFHNIIAKRLTEGPFINGPSKEAQIAYSFFGNELVETDTTG